MRSPRAYLSSLRHSDETRGDTCRAELIEPCLERRLTIGLEQVVVNAHLRPVAGAAANPVNTRIAQPAVVGGTVMGAVEDGTGRGVRRIGGRPAADAAEVRRFRGEAAVRHRV